MPLEVVAAFRERGVRGRLHGLRLALDHGLHGGRVHERCVSRAVRLEPTHPPSPPRRPCSMRPASPPRSCASGRRPRRTPLRAPRPSSREGRPCTSSGNAACKRFARRWAAPPPSLRWGRGTPRSARPRGTAANRLARRGRRASRNRGLPRPPRPG
nr:MAG TPA_asm: hypothetical protein [Caudoviricetes sp.]